MKKICAILAVAALVAPAAVADMYESSSSIQSVSSKTPFNGVRPTQLVNGVTRVQFAVDISGAESWDPFGDFVNEIQNVNLGALSGFGPLTRVVGIGFDATLETVGASWASEAQINMSDSGNTAGVNLTPGIGDNAPTPVGGTNYSSGGVIDLIGLNLQFDLAADGILRIEFHEYYDDVDGAVDANWLAGSTLTFDVVEIPEPATAALLAIGGIALIRRRRA
jgi:hypothetical protein